MGLIIALLCAAPFTAWAIWYSYQPRKFKPPGSSWRLPMFIATVGLLGIWAFSLYGWSLLLHH